MVGRPSSRSVASIPLCFLICIVRCYTPTHGDVVEMKPECEVEALCQCGLTGRGLPGFQGRQSVDYWELRKEGKFNLKEVKFSFLPSVSLCLREQLLS